MGGGEVIEFGLGAVVDVQGAALALEKVVQVRCHLCGVEGSVIGLNLVGIKISLDLDRLRVPMPPSPIHPICVADVIFIS